MNEMWKTLESTYGTEPLKELLKNSGNSKEDVMDYMVESLQDLFNEFDVCID